jgi:hypothetical protein
LWEKNFASIKRNYPQLAEKLNALVTDNAGSCIEIQQTPSGAPTLKLDGVLVHSARNPLREAAKFAAAALQTGQPAGSGAAADDKSHGSGASAGGDFHDGGGISKGAVAILGFGLGYTAEAVMKAAPACVLIIIEKRPEVFIAALNARDISALFEGGRNIFIIGGDNSGIIAALSVAREVRATLRNHSLIKLDEEWYSGVEQNIALWRTKDEVNAATLRRFGRRWIRNLAGNLSAIRDLPGISFLSGKFDFPVLLIAAGPSLDEIRHCAVELSERCLIIAVDTALRFLRLTGVKADFVVSADPQYWNLRHLDNLERAADCLVADPSVQSAALRLHEQIFLTSSVFPLGKFIEDAVGRKGALGAGGSVATSAFDFACLLRNAANTPIYIAGLDLSFTGFRTHYKGALFEEQNLVVQHRFLPAETTEFTAMHAASPYFAQSMDGNKVLTDKRLSLYARWFENRFKNYPETPVFSLSGAGLSISGLQTATLDALLSLPCCRKEINRRKEAVFSEISAEWNSENAAVRVEKFNAARKELLDGLEEIYEAARTAYHAAGQAIKDISKTEKAADQFKAANKVLESSRIKEIVSFLLSRENQETTGSVRESLTISSRIYKNIMESVEFNVGALRRNAWK